MALAFSVVLDRLIANGVRKGAITFARDRPSRYETEKNATSIVVRGPVPRMATIARDRPSHYETEKTAAFLDDHEGQALALRP